MSARGLVSPSPDRCIKYDEMTGLEYTSLRVPYENLNRKFRNGQKNLDRLGFKLMKEAVPAVNCAMGDGTKESSAAEMDTPLKLAIQRLAEFEKISEDTLDEEIAIMEMMEKRIQFLQEGFRLSGEEREEWELVRYHKMVAEQLYRMNCLDTANCLLDEGCIGYLVDGQLYEEAAKVLNGIHNHDTKPLLAWCMEHRSKLRRMDSKLELSARLQDAIECIKNSDRKGALAIIRKYMGRAADSQWPEDTEKAMALLGCGKGTTHVSQLLLLSDKRWDDIGELFKMDLMNVYQLPEHSPLSVAMQTGMCAFKTPSCCPGTTNDCPTCDPSTFQLSNDLPYAHVSNSRLLCSYSGDALNEDNVPMLLPSGYVYGEKALSKLRDESTGGVKCPRSGNIFNANTALRLFIL